MVFLTKSLIIMKLKKFFFFTIFSAVVMFFVSCDPNQGLKPPVTDVVPAEVSVEFETTQFEISIKVTPNDSVMDYRLIILEEDEMPVQLEQFGPMFGIYDTLSYVQAFGAECEGVHEHTFTKMNPNTKWELFVLPRDLHGETAPLQIFTTTTKSLGGSGEAKIAITVGEYTSYINENGELQCVQYVSVVPNDQCALYRYMLITQDAYNCDTLDWGEKGVLDYLKLDNNPAYPAEMQDPYWNLYAPAEDGWFVVPSTEYYVFGIGKNLDGVYGSLVREEFTTPAAAEEEGEEKNTVAAYIGKSNIKKSF